MPEPPTSRNPLITVITPTFNGVGHLRQCVANVADQGVADVEHIVVDGGSRDGSSEVLAELAAIHPHLRHLSEPDRGQSDALNKGVALARGPILGVLNVDDTYEPGVLDRVVSLFSELPEPSFVTGNCAVRDFDGRVKFVNRPRRLRLWQLLLGTELVQFPLNPAAYFYHRSLHDRIGGYAEDLSYAMDLDFVLRAVQTATVHYVGETWGNFWLSPECKTVAAGVTGVGIAERNAVYRRFRRDLPPLTQWLVATVFEATQTKLFDMLLFMSRRPDLALHRLGHHLRRACRPRSRGPK